MLILGWRRWSRVCALGMVIVFVGFFCHGFIIREPIEFGEFDGCPPGDECIGKETEDWTQVHDVNEDGKADWLWNTEYTDTEANKVQLYCVSNGEANWVFGVRFVTFVWLDMHTKEERAYWVGLCPYNNALNDGLIGQDTQGRFTWVEWTSTDSGEDDDGDGRLDRMTYAFNRCPDNTNPNMNDECHSVWARNWENTANDPEDKSSWKMTGNWTWICPAPRDDPAALPAWGTSEPWGT
jgi:hypothetical protein